MDPYIGVTGFMSKDEVTEALSFLPQSSCRKLMVGVLASYKTLFEGRKNKWPNRYPEKDDIADIFPSSSRTLNLIHYNTGHRDTLVKQLAKAVEIGGPNLHGFQLNIAWPDLNQIQEFKALFPDQVIVLQLGWKTFYFADDTPMSPRALAVTANNYSGVDYFLLDKSGGYGTLIEDDIINYVGAFYDTNFAEYRRTMIGVAGGLSGETIGAIAPILNAYPEVSIDAEGRLRTSDDHLDLSAVRAYIEGALRVYSDYQPI